MAFCIQLMASAWPSPFSVLYHRKWFRFPPRPRQKTSGDFRCLGLDELAGHLILEEKGKQQRWFPSILRISNPRTGFSQLEKSKAPQVVKYGSDRNDSVLNREPAASGYSVLFLVRNVTFWA